MATEFGKLLRIWRIEIGVNMAKMAETLNLSTAYLSAIELGKKKVPEDLIERISSYFSLDADKRQSLVDAALKSNGEVRFKLSDYNAKDQDNVMVFARKYHDLTEEKKDQLRRLLDSE